MDNFGLPGGVNDSPEGMPDPVSPHVLLAMQTNVGFLLDLSRAQPDDFISFVVRPMVPSEIGQDVTVGPVDRMSATIINDVLLTTDAWKVEEAEQSPDGQAITLYAGTLGNDRVVYLEKIINHRTDEQGHQVAEVRLIGSMKRPKMPEQAGVTKESKFRKLANWILRP